MPHLLDFASLFQLGAGVSLALSVFREPISYREETLRVRLGHELNLIGSADLDTARARREAVLLAMADLEEASGGAKAMARWPMVLVILGIFLNLTLLICATLNPTRVISLGSSIALISVSIGPYVLGLASLWFIADVKFSSVVHQISKFRASGR